MSEERKEQILEAAMEVFARSGFHGARMDDIAKQAGLSKGALYWYFDGKDAIIQGIMDRMFAREFEQMGAFIDADIPAKEKLVRYLELTLDDITNDEYLVPIMYEFWAMLLRKKRVKEVLGSYYKNFFDIAIPIIQKGVDNGEFRKVNAEDVAITIGAFIEGMFVLWAAIPDVVVLERHLRAGANLIIESLSPHG
ncbi:MAG: TetR/AcrR family transcriptional regulator [Anaerolineales bacterium]